MQEIIVYILIITSVIYTVYNIFGIFIKKESSSCGCSGCSVKEKLK